MSLAAYVMRAAAVLIAMSACSYFLVRYFKKNNITLNGTREAEILTSLRLTGRDIFFVVRCGPDVIAFTLGPGGACLMGRWSYEDWCRSKDEN